MKLPMIDVKIRVHEMPLEFNSFGTVIVHTF